jgi:glucose-6-phosphate dehydrogenase assembly protein OpcA
MTRAATIEPEKILRELRELWRQLGGPQEGAGGVLRACSMTLMVMAEADHAGADAETARRTIGVLMRDHPSRAIIVSPGEGGESGAQVFAECWTPLGSERQICAEGIDITADAEQTDELARVLVPLIEADLPVVLWCRGRHAYLDRSLDPLFALAGKIIFDTETARNPASAIEFLRRIRKEARQVADLAWTRLTAWREAISYLFDCHGGVGGIASVRVTHGGEKPGTGPLYLMRWIERALPGVSITLESAAREAGLHAVTFSRKEGDLSVRLADPSCLEIRDCDRSYASPLPAVSEESLMREELSIPGVDPVFERVLA